MAQLRADAPVHERLGFTLYATVLAAAPAGVALNFANKKHALMRAAFSTEADASHCVS
jgi:hypothetical protein